jgi:hypothetical protein
MMGFGQGFFWKLVFGNRLLKLKIIFLIFILKIIFKNCFLKIVISKYNSENCFENRNFEIFN